MAFHSIDCVGIITPSLPSGSIFGLSRVKLACFGIVVFCIIKIVFITDATPEDASVWPILSLTEPTKT